MLNKMLRISLVVTSCLTTGLTAEASDVPSHAMKNWYVRADAGTSIRQRTTGDFATKNGWALQKNSKNVGMFDVGVGVYFNPSLRGDIQYQKFNKFTNRLTNASIQSVATNRIRGEHVFATLYYDFVRFEVATPYVFAGVGYGTNTVSDSMINTPVANATIAAGKHRGVAYQLGLGASFAIAEGVHLDPSYRYTNYGRINTGSSMTIANVQTSYAPDHGRLESHAFMAGIRLSF